MTGLLVDASQLLGELALLVDELHLLRGDVLQLGLELRHGSHVGRQVSRRLQPSLELLLLAAQQSQLLADAFQAFLHHGCTRLIMFVTFSQAHFALSRCCYFTVSRIALHMKLQTFHFTDM